MNSFGKQLFFFAALLFCFSGFAQSDPIQTIDLKPLVGKSQFTRFDIEWMLPRGRQVADGVPFQIDGIIELEGKSSSLRTSLHADAKGIVVGKTFDELHLLCCTTGGAPTGKTAVATIRLNYDDGTMKELALVFGTNIRQWWGPRHEDDSELLDKRTKPAWAMEIADAAKSDKRSRFFHTILTNPSPDKLVKTIDLLSTKSIAGTLIAAISVGPKNASPLMDTLHDIPPDPESLVRTGDPAAISGSVIDENGRAMSNVVVRIVSTREIKSSEESTEHPAVAMEVKTDVEGKFRFEKVADNRLYRLLAVRERFEPFVFFNVDPRRGAIAIRLRVAKPLVAKQKYFTHAKLVGPDGKPVVGAIVEPYGTRTQGGGGSWGGNQGFADSVTSNGNGEFLLERHEAFSEVQVDVRPLGLARIKVWLDATNKVQTVDLGIGATITGRVLKDGKPIAKAKIAVSGQNRSSEVYAGDFSATTDENGRFVMKHLPPNTSWNLYGGIRSLRAYGALHNRLVMTGAHGEQHDVGDLQVEPALTLAGKVVAKAGQTLPNKLQVGVSYETGGGDTVTVGKNGRFEVTGLYSGMLEVYIQPYEWIPTAMNRSIDDWNPWWLIGKFEQTKTDLLIVIEKKGRNYDYWNGNGQLPQQDQARQRPLFGAEDSGPPWIYFGGTVIDDKTEKPIAAFSITHGRKPPQTISAPSKPVLQKFVESIRGRTPRYDELPFWDRARTETFSNGVFSIAMMPLTSTPMLRIEAKGYEGYESEPMPASNTNLVIRLKKGTGPEGIVVLPDGKPAEGATVILAGLREQFSLQGAELSSYGKSEQFQKTKKDGRFSFPARVDSQRLFVSHPEGWANVALSRFSNGNQIQLQPWACITGTLVDAKGKPVANETMGLMMNHDWNTGEAFVNFQENPITDAKGQFRFAKVPPEPLQLHRMVPMPGRGGGRTYMLQTRFVAEAGKTNDLGQVILDTPPPPSAFEELKQKFGF